MLSSCKMSSPLNIQNESKLTAWTQIDLNPNTLSLSMMTRAHKNIEVHVRPHI